MATTSSKGKSKKHTDERRRGRGEGSLYYNEQRGLWCASINLGTDADGRRIRKTLTSKNKAEVVQKMRDLTSCRDFSEMQSELTTGMSSSAYGVYEYTKSYLSDYKQYTVKSRTYRWYCDIAMNIKIGFAGRMLSDIKPVDVQRFYNRLAADKSIKTIKHIHTLLKQVFNHAVTENHIPVSPINSSVCIPKAGVACDEGKALSKPAIKSVFDALESSMTFKPIVTLMLYSGLRVGEVMALKWKDIDEENMALHIERAATKEYKEDAEGKFTKRKVIGGTKTAAGKRVLPLDPVEREVLNEWRSILTKRNKIPPSGVDLVFPNRSGELRSYDGFRRSFDRFLETHKLDKLDITFHRFRHTFATLMMEQGVNPRIVQEMLGHRDIQTTLGIYTTVSLESLQLAGNKIGQAMADVKNSEKQAPVPT